VCRDDAATLIPWYARGSLDDADKRLVEAHLDRCAECRELLTEARMLLDITEWDDAALLDHVHAQHLDDFARDPASVEPGLADWIRRHLAGCDVCRDAHAILERSHAAPTVTPRVETSPSRGWWLLLSRTLLHPAAAAAYLVVIALSIPAYRVWLAPPETPASPAASGFLDVQVVSAGSRAAQAPARIAVPREGTVPLGIEIESLEDVGTDDRVRVVILDGRSEMWSSEIATDRAVRSLSNPGFLLVLVPREKLQEGRHTGRVERRRDGESIPLWERDVEVVPATP
jgi:hypothetical protein